MKSMFQLMAIPFSQAAKNIFLVLFLQSYMSSIELAMFSQILLIHSVTYLLINLNLTQALSRFLPEIDKINIWKTSSIFWGMSSIIMFGCAIFSLALVLFENNIQKFLFNDNTITFFSIIVIGFVVLENLHINIYSYFRSIGDFKKQALSQVIRVCFEMLAILGGLAILGTFNKNLEFLFGLILLSIFVSNITNYYLALKNKVLLFIKPSFDFLNKYFRYAIPLLPASISFWVISASDRLFISNILGLDLLAVYFIANRICQVISFYLTPFSSVYTYRLSQNNNSNFYGGFGLYLIICIYNYGV